jgi:hypothetical protein
MKVKQTESGAWWVFDEVQGKLLREDQPPHGYDTKKEAQRAACAVLRDRKMIRALPHQIDTVE